ncbi:MAG: AAA family ATPase [Bryobacteraceae bacterium]
MKPDLGLASADPSENSLSFEGTVRNEAIQAWLLSLYSKRAIAQQRHQPTETYSQSLARFEKALEEVYGADVTFEVNIEPSFEPRLRVLGHSLNFSQLPDGIRSTVGWIADYMMRQDAIQWDPKLKGKRPGILLLDEVDAHLHPMWQRRLLPAMRAALPDVQIIVTSHSPFVISSCPNSKVHVMDLNQDGSAYLKASCDAPIGLSVTTTLKEIFGVESRFDIRTERELDEWNELKRHEIRPGLSAPQARRLKTLTKELSGRSEELKSIVATASVPAELLGVLTQSTGKTGNGARRRVRR